MSAPVRLSSIRRRGLGFVLDELIVLAPVAAGVVAWGYRPGDQLSNDALAVTNVVAAAVGFVYATVLVACGGRTVGKIVTGTRVVHAVDAGRVGWYAAAQRAVVPLVAGAVPVVGPVLVAGVYVLAVRSPLRQGLHDRAASTIVVMSGSEQRDIG